jgi:hypothetical protein
MPEYIYRCILSIAAIVLLHHVHIDWPSNNSNSTKFPVNWLDMGKLTPQVRSHCDRVASKQVCWQSGKFRKCTSVWPDSLLEPDSEMPMFLEGSTQPGGLGHAFRSFISLAVLAATNQLTLRAHLICGGHRDDPSAVKEQIFGDYFFHLLPKTCTKTEIHCVSILNLSSVVMLTRQQVKANGTCVVFLLLDRPNPDD